jgi:hypothetical protein
MVMLVVLMKAEEKATLAGLLRVAPPQWVNARSEDKAARSVSLEKVEF